MARSTEKADPQSVLKEGSLVIWMRNGLEPTKKEEEKSTSKGPTSRIWNVIEKRSRRFLKKDWPDGRAGGARHY